MKQKRWWQSDRILIGLVACGFCGCSSQPVQSAARGHAPRGGRSNTASSLPERSRPVKASVERTPVEKAPVEKTPIEVVKTSKNSFGFYAKAYLNGVPRRFRIDSGASGSSVANDRDTKDLQSSGSKSFSSVGGGATACDQVTVGLLRFSGRELKSHPFLRCAGAKEGSEFDTIGLDAFDQSVWAFDFASSGDGSTFGTLPSMPDRKSAQKMKRGPQRHILLPVQIGGTSDGVAGYAAFDTGTAVTAVDSEFVDAHPQFFKAVRSDVTHIGDGTNQKVAVSFYNVEAFKVGSVDFRRQLVTSFRFPKELKRVIQSSVILGTNTMMMAHWTLDLKNNVWSAKLIP